jgi:hypothetical protein
MILPLARRRASVDDETAVLLSKRSVRRGRGSKRYQRYRRI